LKEPALIGERIAAFYEASLERNYAVALWRLPGAPNTVALATPSAIEIPQISIAAPSAGFVFAPFSEDRPSLFLPAHHLLDEGGLHSAADQTKLDLAHVHAPAQRWHLAPDTKEKALTQSAYEGLVADAIAFIRSAQIAKVVVSRTAPVALPAGFNPLTLYAVLCRRYPSAFVSLVTLPGVGAWLGASPELLLRTHGDHVSTVALAGTHALPAGGDMESIAWGAKELAEQEMVSAYIRGVFHEAGAQQVAEEGPTTVAGAFAKPLLG
jgi:isochorismate synthase